jgi:hypothetical protein
MNQVFSEPLYGIVGGLHFPVPEGRLKLRDAYRHIRVGERILVGPSQ